MVSEVLGEGADVDDERWRYHLDRSDEDEKARHVALLAIIISSIAIAGGLLSFIVGIGCASSLLLQGIMSISYSQADPNMIDDTFFFLKAWFVVMIISSPTALFGIYLGQSSKNKARKKNVISYTRGMIATVLSISGLGIEAVALVITVSMIIGYYIMV